MSKKDDVSAEEFDDLDFEDLDADEDFGDESWDEFDGSEDESAAEDDIDINEDNSNVPAKKKTFLQKKFNLIVIAVAVLVGGGFVLTQLGGGTNKASQKAPEQAHVLNAPPQELQDIPELTDDLPPMPAPIETPDNDLADANFENDLDFSIQDSTASDQISTVDASPTNLESDGVLTPLPDLAETADTDLADLDVVLQEDVRSASALQTTPEAATPLEDMAADDIVAVPEDDFSDNALDLMDSEPDDVAAESEDTAFTENVEGSVGADVALAPVPLTDENTGALEAEIQELNSALDKSKAALEMAEKTENRLSRDLQAANAHIQSLDAEINVLRDEINTLKNGKAATSEDVKTTPQEKPSAAASDAKSSTEVSPSPAVVNTAQDWVLKSASYGRAVLSPKNNSDIRQVEVGDRVPGLGKVLSISLENNLWVVRGETGAVSQ
ncbi:MAG: hypothetical protein H6861_04265 [Rhodospirillales bacterium]|nr:hypothetical protein [Rhodospirillales bacterium]